MAPAIRSMFSNFGMATIPAFAGTSLIGFLIHLRLPKYRTLLRGKGGNHVDRVIGAFFLG